MSTTTMLCSMSHSAGTQHGHVLNKLVLLLVLSQTWPLALRLQRRASGCGSVRMPDPVWLALETQAAVATPRVWLQAGERLLP